MRKIIYIGIGILASVLILKVLILPKGNLRPILTGERRSALNPIISPHGDKIIFIYRSYRYANSDGLYIVDINGNNLKPIIEGANLTDAGLECVWSPNGNLISFVMGGKIYLYEIGKNSFFEIMAGNNPVWSFDGKGFVFIATAIVERPVEAEGWLTERHEILPAYNIKKVSVPIIMFYNVDDGLVSQMYEVQNYRSQLLQYRLIDEKTLRIVMDSLSVQQIIEKESWRRLENTFAGWNIKDIDVGTQICKNALFIPRDDEKMKFIGISPNGKKALLFDRQTVLLVDIGSSIMEKIIDSKVNRIAWGRNGESIIYDISNQIWMYDIANNNMKKIAILKGKVFSPTSENAGIYVIAAHLPTGDPVEDGYYERSVLFTGKIK